MTAPRETDKLIGGDDAVGWWCFWQIPVVILFVVLGAGQAVATRASMVDGHLPYDSSAAVSCAEIAKLVLSILWILAFNRKELSHVSRKALMFESFELFAIAVLFALQNELNFIIIEKLGAALFMVLGNLKIVFTCVFMSALLGKKFANLQWFGIALLTLSTIVVKIPVVVDMYKHGSGTSQSLSVVGLVLLFISTASSGLASVANELILKRGSGAGAKEDTQIPFMLKNGVLYGWGTLLNLLSWVAYGKDSFDAVFTRMGMLSILSMVGMGLMCAVILRYLDNVVRCFSSVTMVLFTVLLSRMLQSHLREGSFDIYYVASLVILAASLTIYQAHTSPSLLLYVVVACCGAMCTGMLCMTFDH